MRLAFALVMMTLVACGAESPTAPTADASATGTDCPRTRVGSVARDGGVCVYTCPSDYVGCPGVGCVDLAGNPDHCGACGNACTPTQMCDHAAGSRDWFCRNNP